MMTPPPKMADIIIEWANKRLEKEDWNQTSKKFKVDFTGWKYNYRRELADVANLKRADKWLGRITVVLIRIKDGSRAKSLGSFSYYSGRLKIKICNGMLIDVVILHELIHWSQGYLELLSGYIPNKKRRVEYFFTVGYPSKKIRDFYIVPQYKDKHLYRKEWKKRGIKSDEELHFLSDIEFYPNLYLLCLKFTYICYSLGLDDKEKKEAFRIFTGVKKYDELNTNMKLLFGTRLKNASDICCVFKKFSPMKWRKYVKEIYKKCIIEGNII